MRSLLAGLALLASSVFLTSCASSNGEGEVSRHDGSIPWNRPEKWEGPGVLGSQMGQGR